MARRLFKLFKNPYELKIPLFWSGTDSTKAANLFIQDNPEYIVLNEALTLVGAAWEDYNRAEGAFICTAFTRCGRYSHKVAVILGVPFRPSTLWDTIEKPALMENLEVNHVLIYKVVDEGGKVKYELDLKEREKISSLGAFIWRLLEAFPIIEF